MSKFKAPKQNAMMNTASTGSIGQALESSPTNVASRRGNGQSPEQAVSTTNRGVDQMSGEQAVNMYAQSQD
jgi:hypothetical protein